MSVHLPLRPSVAKTTSTTFICQQCRRATLLRRPKRPYTFTQLVTLSDGSAFTQRTTSPLPVYRSTRDTRNAPMWNPSSSKLTNVEEDEAGRLAAFRERFGRGFDASTASRETAAEQEEEKSAQSGRKTETRPGETGLEGYDEEEESMLDLISSFGQEGGGQTSKTQDTRQKSGRKGPK